MGKFIIQNNTDIDDFEAAKFAIRAMELICCENDDGIVPSENRRYLAYGFI